MIEAFFVNTSVERFLTKPKMLTLKFGSWTIPQEPYGIRKAICEICRKRLMWKMK